MRNQHPGPLKGNRKDCATHLYDTVVIIYYFHGFYQIAFLKGMNLFLKFADISLIMQYRGSCEWSLFTEC